MAVVVLAALIRFLTLGVKSYWLDEGLTVQLLHLGFGQMLHSLHTTEPNPPFYFALAWIWARLFGYGEFALRSLSALAGLLTIPLTYFAARRLIGRRGALITAALLAVNPMLVWYSQEARSYALFVFLAALSLIFLARALERPSAGTLAGGTLSCVLMLGTHYFAVFLIVSEAAWVLWLAGARLRKGWLLTIVTLPLIAIAVAVWQSQGPPAASANGEGSSLLVRLISLPGSLLVGFEAPERKLYAVLSTLLVILALVVLFRRAPPAQRRGVLICGSVGVATVALPVAAAMLGYDYVNARNVIVAVLPLWIIIGAGFGLMSRTAAALATLGLSGVALVAVVVTICTPKYHYQDWRSVAATMGPPTSARAVIVAPSFGIQALAVYLPGGLQPLSRSSPAVSEIDVVATVQLKPGQTSDPLPPVPHTPAVLPAAGVGPATVTRRRRFTLVRYISRSPLRVTPGIKRAADFAGGGAAVLIEPAPR